MPDKTVRDFLNDNVRRVVKDAEIAVDTEIAEARAAGVEAARRHYHNPDEPRQQAEEAGAETSPPPEPPKPEEPKEDALPSPEPPKPRARRTDPPTSHNAAESVARRDVTAVQNAIRTLLHFHGGMTDGELIEAYQTYAKREGFPEHSESGIRTRRSELVRLGHVEDSGATKILPSGRPSIIWKETPRNVGLLCEGGTDAETTEAAARQARESDGRVRDE